MRKVIRVPFSWNEIKFEYPEHSEEYNRLKVLVFQKGNLKQGNNPYAIGLQSKSLNCLFSLLRGVAHNKFNELRNDNGFKEYLLAEGINNPIVKDITFDMSKEKITFLYHFDVEMCSAPKDFALKFDDICEMIYSIQYVQSFCNPRIEIYKSGENWYMIIKQVSDIRFQELINTTEIKSNEWGNPYFKGEVNKFMS